MHRIITYSKTIDKRLILSQPKVVEDYLSMAKLKISFYRTKNKILEIKSK